MSKVYINGRSVIHKGDGQINTCAVPDVCKTPSPGGPIPIPYVNVARDGDLAQGSTSVSLKGNSIALKDSSLSTSSGDEPGTAGGGLVSSKTKGKMTWASASIDVKIEGKGVIRFLEPTQHNGNTFNTAFIQNGQTGFAYGDDRSPKAPCPLCSKPRKKHRIHEHTRSKALTQTLVDKLEEMRKRHATLFQSRQQLEARLQQSRDSLASQQRQGADTRELGKLLKALESEFRALGSLVGNTRVLRDSEDGGGYMIGVLICHCGQKIYAAMSGKETGGFKEAVKELGWTLAGPITSPLVNGNGPISSADEQDLRNVPKDLPGRHNNPFGQCAAPKLVQAARKSAPSHKPYLMTEQLYSPTNASKKVKVRYKRDGKTVSGRFLNGATVPSCRTCQNTLPQLLCGDKPCP